MPPYPEPVMSGLLVLLGCQLAGELLVRTLDVPVPGPVAGMVLLLAWLQVRDPDPDSGLARTADGLLRHLQLLFVPAGTGVIQYAALVGASATPLVLGLVVSWAAALLATVGTTAAVLAVGRRRRAAQ